MDIVCSSSGIVYLMRPDQGAMDLASAGFKRLCLEIDMCCSPHELEGLGKETKEEKKLRESSPEYQKEERQRKERGMEEWVSILDDFTELERHFKPVLDICRSHGIDFSIARAPYLLRDTEREDLEETLIWLHQKCIEYCGKIGCQKIIIQPLFSGLSGKEEWEKNREYFLKLAPTARKYHVMILLENLGKDYNGHIVRGICSDGRSAAQWVDWLNQEEELGAKAEGTARAEETCTEDNWNCFGFCMDTGMCNLCGQNMYEFAKDLGFRLSAVILRDSNGRQDGRMLPFTCAYHGQPQTDWLSLIRGLREIGFDGSLILDIQDTASVFSPILRPQLLKLAKSVADYFKWQIEIENLLKRYPSIVLFGAGNMCRNFMKCYGESYPPLFTCDNNKNIWGTMFCGLEVKPPDALKSLPKDCGIFICNIYYREIEQQLREMGIQNKIEFFNDEYMPSFHFDRLMGV